MKTQQERMGILETEVKNIKEEVCLNREQNTKEHSELKDMIQGFMKTLESKADKAELVHLEQATIHKADKVEVDRLNRVIGWTAALIVSSMFGLIIFLIQKHII